jgi:ketosteroid isomerase-like protein
MDERRAPDDVADFIGAYAEAWTCGDLDRIVGAYATPCYVVKDGRVLHHDDEPAKRRYFGDLLAGNRRQGPHLWSVADLDSYLLAADEGRWRILGDVVHA